MAFFRKAGTMLKMTLNNNIGQELLSSNPSIFQAIRSMSTSKLFVGGLSFSTDDSSLRESFCKYGEVAEARVIVDRETGRSRGFGFVTYTTTEEASAAIQALDQQELHGRTIRVNYATERAPGGGGGGYGGGGYGGGGGGYGGGGYGGGGGGGGYRGGGGGGYGGGGYGGGSNYGSPAGGESNDMGGATKGFNEGGDPFEGSNRDGEDNAGNYAERRG